MWIKIYERKCFYPKNLFFLLNKTFVFLLIEMYENIDNFHHLQIPICIQQK